MIKEIINIIKTPILNLDWLGVFGGVAVPIKHPHESGSITYPIAANSGSDCWNNGRYMDLVPDASKSSILYFEQSTPIKFSTITIYEQQASTMLTGYLWANQLRLGEDICIGAPKDLISILGFGINTVKFDGSDLYAIETSIEQIHTGRETNKSFAQYNYKGSDSLYLYPNAIVSFDLSVTWKMSKDCLTYTPDEETTCIDLT